MGDPYSVYYTADELETLQEKTQGIYYGIGARVSLDTETQLPKIASVISGTPAEEAGLMANDLLYKADDTELQGMDLSSAVALIRGEEGTSVHLTVIRSGESNYLEFDVVRRKLANETVTSKMLDDSMLTSRFRSRRCDAGSVYGSSGQCPFGRHGRSDYRSERKSGRKPFDGM